MFLFSGAFFPIANLAAPLEWLARMTPLWHGVELSRMLLARRRRRAAGRWCTSPTSVALAVVGWWCGVRRLDRRLVV